MCLNYWCLNLSLFTIQQPVLSQVQRWGTMIAGSLKKHSLAKEAEIAVSKKSTPYYPATSSVISTFHPFFQLSRIDWIVSMISAKCCVGWLVWSAILQPPFHLFHRVSVADILVWNNFSSSRWPLTLLCCFSRLLSSCFAFCSLLQFLWLGFCISITICA